MTDIVKQGKGSLNLKKINKVLLIFLLFIMALIGGIWHIVQTDTFSGIVSQKISYFLNHSLHLNVRFKRIDLQLFPLGVDLYDVELKKTDPEITFQVAQLGIYVDPLGLLTNEVVIQKVTLEKGKLQLAIPPTPDEEKITFAEIQDWIKKRVKEDQSHLGKWIFEQIETLSPYKIKKIFLSNMDISSSDFSLSISQMSLQMEEASIQLDLLLQSIYLEKKRDRPTIDSLNLKMMAHHSLQIDELTLLAQNSRFHFKGDLYLQLKNLLLSPIKGQYTINLDLPYLISKLKWEKYIIIDEGLLQLSGDIKKRINNPTISYKGHINQFDCEYAKVEQLDFQGEFSDKKALLHTLKIKDGEGTGELERSMTLFDGPKKKLLPDPLWVKLNRLETKSIFYFLDGDLDPWEATISGRVRLDYHPGPKSIPDILSIIVEKKEAKMENFKLYFAKDNLTVLSNPLLNIDDLHLKVNLGKPARVEFQAKASGPFSLDAKGQILGNDVDITASSNQFDFSKLGPLAGQKITGVGPVALHVHGNFKNDVLMDMDFKLQESSLLDFHLGSVNGKGEFNFKKVTFHLEKGEGVVGESHYWSMGSVDFKKKQVDIEVDHYEALCSNLIKTYLPLIKKIPYWPEEIECHGELNFHATGGLDLSQLKVEGQGYFENLNWKEEEVDSAQAQFLFDQRKLQINEIVIKKDEGELTGYYSYALNRERSEYDLKLKGLDVTKLALYRRLTPGVSGEVEGVIRKNQELQGTDSEVKLYLKKSRLQDKVIPDSYMNLTIKDEMIKGNLSLFGDLILSKFDIDQNRFVTEKKSVLDIRINSDDMAFLATLFGVYNLKDSGIKGVMRGKLKAYFPGPYWHKMDAFFDMQEFYLSKNDVHFRLLEDHSQFQLKEGSVVKWNIKAVGDNGERFSSKARGILGDQFVIDNYFNFDASILEGISSKVASSSGPIENHLTINNEKESWSFELESIGKKIGMVYSGIPGGLEDVNYNILLNNKEFKIKLLTGHFANGLFNVNGKMEFLGSYPLCNFTYNLDSANLSFFEKTMVTVNGSGRLVGEAPPYLLSGEVAVVRGEIFDDFEKMSQGKKDVNVSYRFIPQVKKKSFLDLVNLDIKLDILDNIHLKNSMAEMRFDGSLDVEGSLKRPQIEGNISLSSDFNRFYFKNNEFNVVKGLVQFNKNGEGFNPDIDFQAVGHINEYDVFLNIAGKSSNPEIEFSTNPFLSQQDIFSLLTLGYTGDVSQGLTARERDQQYLTSAGGFIFDKMRLNENLKSALGLNLSLSTDVSPSDAGRSAAPETVESFQLGQYRAGTKISVNKKLSRKVNLSASSTLGGDTSAKQEVNLNYQFSRKISLDGVYELRPDETKGGSTGSVGADIKFKWTFR